MKRLQPVPPSVKFPDVQAKCKRCAAALTIPSGIVELVSAFNARHRQSKIARDEVLACSGCYLAIQAELEKLSQEQWAKDRIAWMSLREAFRDKEPKPIVDDLARKLSAEFISEHRTSLRKLYAKYMRLRQETKGSESDKRSGY